MFGRKYCRKRKIRAKAVPRKKLTSFKREDGVSDDTSEDHSYKQQWRASGNEEESYFETGNTASGDSSNQMSDPHKGIIRHKGYKEFESDDEVSDRSLGEEYTVRACAASESSMENGSQHSMYDHDDDDDDIDRQPRGIPRSQQTRVFRNPVSYESEDNGVYQQSGRISISNRQANRMVGEYDSAENSLEERGFCSTGKRQTRSTAKRIAKTKTVQSSRDTKGRFLQEFASGKKNEELAQSLKVLCALNCHVLEEDESLISYNRFKGKVLLALFTNVFDGLASIFADNTKKPKDIFAYWRELMKTTKDKTINDFIHWIEWIISHTLLRTAECNPEGLDDFWLNEGAALLLNLMQSSQEDVQERSATGLATFVVVDDENASIDCGRAEAVMKDGGIRLLLELAKSWRFF